MSKFYTINTNNEQEFTFNRDYITNVVFNKEDLSYSLTTTQTEHCFVSHTLNGYYKIKKDINNWLEETDSIKIKNIK